MSNLPQSPRATFPFNAPPPSIPVPSPPCGDQFFNPCQPKLFPTPNPASLPAPNHYIVTRADLSNFSG